MGFRSWLWSKMGMPVHREQRQRRELAWDYAQANDRAICDADPAIEHVREASSLLDRDPERAFVQLLALAQKGSVWGMLTVGWCCEVGHGTPANLADAEHFYRRAHEAGCDRAMIPYARVLRFRGASDMEMQAYSEAAARGWAPALYRVARLGLAQATTREARLAFKTPLERAAEMGSPAAKFLLAAYMASGRLGLSHVPAGIRLIHLFLRDRLAAMDGEGAIEDLPLLVAP